MKKYTIQIGEVFTEEKAKELKEYLELKDEEIKKLIIDCTCKEPWTLGVVHRKLQPCYWPPRDNDDTAI